MRAGGGGRRLRFADVARRLADGAAADRLPPPPDVLIPVRTDGTEPRPRVPIELVTGAHPAAVLVLVVPDPAGDALVVLTERVDRGGHHAGEVSFPGGAVEPADAGPVEAALREATEEVGLDPAAAGVRVLGQLEPFWIPVSNFRVTPVLAIADRLPALVAQPDEVVAILLPPLARFLPGAPLEVVERTVGGWPLRYGAYPIDGRLVWGATARVLSQLGALLA